MSPVDNLESRIGQLHRSTSAEIDRRILGDAAAALQERAHEQQTSIWRLIVTSRMARPIAAAAVILIAVGLFLSKPARNAETIEGFYSTLAGAENICVTEFQAGRTNPQQQVWTSQGLKVRLFKTEGGNKTQYSLFDIDEKVQMTVFLSTVQTVPLTEQMLADIEESMTPSFVLSPFFDANDVPSGARWERVRDPAVIAVVPGCLVYDLTWKPVAAGAERKWRVYADTSSHLPRRTEIYVKSDPEAEYELVSFVLVTYPSESEIQDIVVRTFGEPGTRTSEPEYLPTPGFGR